MSNKYLVKEESLSSVADAIREKTNTSDPMLFPSEFISNIESIISTGDDIVAAINASESLIDDDNLSAEVRDAIAKAHDIHTIADVAELQDALDLKETITGATTKASTAESNAKTYADELVTDLLGSAPATLDTLNELAEALGNDPNFATTITNSLATKADKTYVDSKVQTDVPSGAKFTDTITTINGKTGTISKADIVALGIPAQDTVSDIDISGKADITYVDDKVKTDVPVDAKFTDTVYTHPASHPASMITESSTKRFVSDTKISEWDGKETPTGAQAKADTAEQNAKDYADAGLADKVDKVTGKGLSTNDYTTTEKNKLAGVEAGAQVNTVTSVAGKTGAVKLSKADVEEALGFTPFNPVGGVTTKRKETVDLYMLMNHDSSTDIDISASNTIMVMIEANNVVVNFVNMNTTPNTNDTVRMIYANWGDAYINHDVDVDGVNYMPQYGGDMYRIPNGTGVIDLNFITPELEGIEETVVIGTTGGGGISIDDLYDILYDIDARSLNGYTQADFVLTVYHGTNEYKHRPQNAGVVMWVGTVEPYYALDNDIWIGG